MRFDQVHFRYGRGQPWTLTAVDTAIGPGETAVVLGRNGAGKSTLLQLAAGVLRPARGVVRDRPAVVGWVPERFPADQPFTTEQYLTGMAALRRLGPDTADRWIERLGLTGHRHTRLNTLSKGTAQKVGLAQALLRTPGLLVLDEPWEGLDAQARTLIPEIVAEVTTAGGAALVSDHRGEIAGLPDAVHWHVTDGRVSTPAIPAPATSAPATSALATSAPAASVPAASAPAASVPAASVPADEVVIEVAVRRAEADRTAAWLSAEGHRVLRVRENDRGGGFPG